ETLPNAPLQGRVGGGWGVWPAMSLGAEPASSLTEPDCDCPLCPRLAAFRETWRAAEPGWYNAPVHTFGSRDARLLVVGLAPGLRGANRTRRPLTRAYARDLLYRTLLAFRLSARPFP